MIRSSVSVPTLALAVITATALCAQAPTRVHRFDGDSAQDRFGDRVRAAGDVDGDGFGDLIVGAYGDDNRGPNSGSARVLSGRTGAVLHSFDGDLAGDRFGASVSGAGDVDGDGFGDVVVGAPRDDDNGLDSGSARVFSGRTGAIVETFFGDSSRDQFGASVGGIGDVDGDGFDDLAVGAPGDDDNGANAGSVRVFSMRTGAVLYTFHGDSAGDELGISVSGAGDVDGDGFGDLIAGAHLDDDNGANSGSARVFSGRTGTALFTFRGDSGGDWFGHSVSGAGDVDGDGFGDLIVGAYLDDNNGTNSGSARVFSGQTGGVLYTFDGNAAAELFGFSVSGAGDFDGDGLDDLVVGAHGTGPGRARVYSGSTGTVAHTFSGDAPLDAFGYSVSGAGDIDGDGFDDFAVGAPMDGRNGTNAGSAQAFSMGYTGTPATARKVGAACAGSNGHLPHIGHVGRPFLGRPLRIALRAARPQTPVVLNLGAPTAIDLSPLGFTGCTLYATADGFVVATSTDAEGMAQGGQVTIPNVASLIGLSIAAQWICLDPGANAGGFTLSDAIQFTLGN